MFRRALLALPIRDADRRQGEAVHHLEIDTVAQQGADGIDLDAVEHHPYVPSTQQPLPHSPQANGVIGDPVRAEYQMIDAVEPLGRDR